MSSTYIHTQNDASFSKLVLKILAVLYFLLLAGVVAYVWVLAEDRYVTQATVKISRQDTSSVEAGFLEMALTGVPDSSAMDSQIVIGFIKSADLLLELEEQFDLVEHYMSPKKDAFFRLEVDAPLETRLEYYRKRISAVYDQESGLTLLSVDTYDPQLSLEVASELLVRAEGFVNKVNQNVAGQQLGFAIKELERTEEQVNKLNREMLELQNKHKIISPEDVISASLNAVQEMRLEQFRGEAELATLLRDSPDSPRIDPLRSQLKSLEELIETQTEKLSGPERDRLNQVLMDYRELEIKLGFANRLRLGAETLLEKTRSEAGQKSRFFSVIQNPYLPEDAALPRRVYATVTILFLGVLFFLVLRALSTSVFERN